MREYKLEEFTRGKLPLLIQKLFSYPSHELIHRHNAVEILYVDHGAGWCAVDGIIHPMLTGDMYIIPVGATHEFCYDQNIYYTNILFHESIFRDEEKELQKLFQAKTPGMMLDKYTFGPELNQEIKEKITMLQKELESDEPYSDLRCRLLFVDFLIFLVRNANIAPGIRASHAQQHLGKVLCYISDHLDSKLLLSDLAELSGYQPDYFGKLFRREIGISVSEYIRNRRIEQACCELTQTNHTMDEIALQTGFFDTSHFIKIFKKVCGMTPAQYRKNNIR